MYKGELSRVIEPPPRTRITISASGLPSGIVTRTPANLPCIASTGEDTGTVVNSLLPTEATAPVISRFFTVP